MTLIGIRQSSIKFGPADTLQPGYRGRHHAGDGRAHRRRPRRLGHQHLVGGLRRVHLRRPRAGRRPSYAVDVKDAVVVAAAGNVGGAGQCPAQNTDSRPAVIASPAWYDDYVLAVGSVNDAGARRRSASTVRGSTWPHRARGGVPRSGRPGPCRQRAGAHRIGPHLGHQLCGTRRQRAGGTGAVPLPANVRAPGHDTDREHRTQAGRRVGPGGRQRRGRSVGRGR